MNYLNVPENLRQAAGWFDDKGFKGKMTLGISSCCAPLHIGHLETLKLTKKYFEDLGYYVEAIIFPAHSSYAQEKTGWTDDMRVAGIQKLLAKEGLDWVSVEWEPMLRYKNEVNFPWLIDILRHRAGYGEIAFAFGEDNSGFAHAFVDSDVHAVIVERKGGFDKLQDELKENRTSSRIKLHFITGNQHKDESSTRIRLSNPG